MEDHLEEQKEQHQQRGIQSINGQQIQVQVKNTQYADIQNNSSLLSVAQSASTQKQEKQSSNDGLNSERSYPSTIFNNNKKAQTEQQKGTVSNFQKKSSKRLQNRHPQIGIPRKTSTERSDFQKYENDSQDSQLRYGSPTSGNKTRTSFTLLKIIFMVFKKQYAFEVIRVLAYAFISITVFAYVLDQSKEKKQFYEAFYSSEQITISKSINGIFPPLFGNQNDILNHTWILETYNSHLVSDSQQIRPNQQLFFQFKTQKVLYIRPNSDKCLEQLKFRFKTFDYNMRIYQVLESQFQKIQEQKQAQTSCFSHKKQINRLMREISIWSIDWQSKQLYLLSQPFREDSTGQLSPTQKAERWNQLIVLKKKPLNI